MKQRFALVAALACLVFSGAVVAQFEDPNVAGRQLFDQKKFAEAAVKFKEALTYVPNDPSILSWLAACHLNLSQYPEAEDALARAVAAGGKEFRFFELLAATQYEQKKVDAAIATVKKYREVAPAEDLKQNEVKLRPFESELHLAKRLECLRATPPNRACGDAEAEAAWAVGANEPKWYQQFAEIWAAAAETPELEAAKRDDYLKRAETATRGWMTIATGPDLLRAKTVLGGLLTKQKRYEDAIPLLQEIVAADPTQISARITLIRAYVFKEDFVTAKQAATEAIAVAPENPQGYLYRAMAEYRLEDCPAVVKDGAEYAKRSAGKPVPGFLSTCKNVLEFEQSEKDRKRREVDDYKKWLMQQLDYGDEESSDAAPAKKPEAPPKKK